jgi:hypothetical protein
VRWRRSRSVTTCLSYLIFLVENDSKRAWGFGAVDTKEGLTAVTGLLTAANLLDKATSRSRYGLLTKRNFLTQYSKVLCQNLSVFL